MQHGVTWIAQKLFLLSMKVMQQVRSPREGEHAGDGQDTVMEGGGG